MSGGVYDLNAARAARNEGMERVLDNSGPWRFLARAAANFHLPYDVELLGEDIRRILKAQGLPEPHHPNCWSSLTGWLSRHDVLSPTGAIRAPRKVSSHASKTQVWIRRSQPW